MKRFLLLILLPFLTLSVVGQKEAFLHDKVKKVWETGAELKVPESVFFLEEKRMVFVSNIVGKPGEKDEKGFISRMTVSGKILDLKWVKRLHAPKGMDAHDGNLYVSDVDGLVVINLGKGEVIKRYPHEKARFLNDVAVTEEGVVYVSDMVANKIFKLQDGNFDIWSEASEFNKPNGLLLEEDRLLVGMKDQLAAINLKTHEISTLVSNTGSIDGLRADGKGHYLISDWSGRVHQIAPEREKVKLLDTTPIDQNAADFEFIQMENLLLIPTFHGNQVIGYQLQP